MVFWGERITGSRSTFQHVDGKRVQLDAVSETSGTLSSLDPPSPLVEQHGADHPHRPGGTQQQRAKHLCNVDAQRLTFREITRGIFGAAATTAPSSE